MKTGNSTLLFALVLLALYATGYSFSLRNTLYPRQTGRLNDRQKRAITAETIQGQTEAAQTGISNIIRSAKQSLRGSESLYISMVIDNSYHVRVNELNIIKSILYESFVHHNNDLNQGKVHVNIIGYSSIAASREYLDFNFKISPTRYPGSGYIKHILEKNVLYQPNAEGADLRDGATVLFHARDILKNQTGRKMVILCSTGQFSDPPVINLDSASEQFKSTDGIEMVSLAVGADFHEANLNRFSSGEDHKFKVVTRENLPLLSLRELLRG